MKAQLTFFAAIIFIAFVSSCGQSEQEKARLQATEQVKNDSIKHVQELREDSIRKVVEDKRNAEIAIKQTLQDSLQMRNASLENARLLLAETKANLKTARNKMDRIKGPKINTTAGERDQQIKSESSYIKSLEEKIITLGGYINQIEAKIAELQTTI